MFYRYQLKAKFLLVTAGILAKKFDSEEVLIFRWIKHLILIPKSQDLIPFCIAN